MTMLVALANLFADKKSPLRNQRGFTLIESLVALGIAAIIGVAAVALLMTGSEVYIDTQVKNEQQLIADGVSEYLSSSIRYAMTMDEYLGSNSSSETAIWWENGAVYQSDDPDTPVFDTDGQWIDLIFDYDGGDMVTVYISVTSTADSSRTTEELMYIKLMNYEFMSRQSSFDSAEGVVFKLFT